jgi:hypothetical protein
MAVLLAFLQFHLRGVVLKCYGVCFFKNYGYLGIAPAWATQEASCLVNIEVLLATISQKESVPL